MQEQSDEKAYSHRYMSSAVLRSEHDGSFPNRDVLLELYVLWAQKPQLRRKANSYYKIDVRTVGTVAPAWMAGVLRGTP
jgi:hypothetical protein